MKITGRMKNGLRQSVKSLRRYLNPDRSYIKWIIRNLSILVILFITYKVIDTNLKYKFWLNENRIIEWDVKNYYSYLPATFIYGDLTLSFVNEEKQAFDRLWPSKTEDGHWLIVTSCGLSILYSPFFLLAHAYAHLSPYAADGYSVPYRFALVFSALFYLLLGLVYLRKTLKLLFNNEFLIAFVILSIALGTNLFYYATHEPAMSHVFNFSLISVFVYYTIRWYQKPYWLNTIGIGLLIGLISLVRPTNILILLFFIFWNITSWKDLRSRIVFFIRRFDLLLIMIASFLVAWFPQFLYWKTVTGHWLYYSYSAKDAGFFFLNPQILNILISYKKGWFVYTPVMAVAFIGIFFMIKRQKHVFWSVFIYICAMIYVLSSWWSWWYGGGFGLRAFIDTYAVMAIPLASLLHASLKKKWIASVSFIVVAVLIWFNTFQIQQYHYRAIHWWWMNKNTYWETFLKLKPTKAYWEMVTMPDYDKAREGVYEAISPTERRRRKRIIQIKKEYISHIEKDEKLRTRLSLEADHKNRLKDIINDYAETNLDTYIYLSRKHKLDSLMDEIRSNALSFEQAAQEAAEKGIPVDSLIKTTAIKQYKNNILEY